MKLQNFKGMVYYIANLTVDKKIIGKYPQIPCVIDGYDETLPNSMTKIKRNEFPDFIPDLRYEVQKNSKITDNLDMAYTDTMGFLVSQKLLDILLKFNIISHRIYEAHVLHKGKWYPYFLLHILPLEDFSGIDFDNSIFFKEQIVPRKRIYEVKFHDEDSFKALRDNFQDKDHWIKADKITLTKNFRNKNIDVFYLKFGLTRVLFSERLVDELKKNKITGFEFEKDDRVN